VHGRVLVAGHLTPDPTTNAAVITIHDLLIHPAAGFWCQDLNANGFCGDDIDSGELFCSTAVLDADEAWNPNLPVEVLLFNVVNGLLDQLGGGPCGTFSATTVGNLEHD
jgi:hypothetical protein